MLEDQKSGFYNPGQLQEIYRHLDGLPEPKWLLLGGPGSANEAQTAAEKWPGIKVIGVDPNPNVILWQREHGWPKSGVILHGALWSSNTVVPMANPGSDLLHGCVYQGLDEELSNALPTAPSVTWDTLDARWGPFEDAILWLDIEGSELEALKGAERLLARGAVNLINVELMNREEERHLWYKIDEFDRIVKAAGFFHARDWNESANCRDRIYVRKL